MNIKKIIIVLYLVSINYAVFAQNRRTEKELNQITKRLNNIRDSLILIGNSVSMMNETTNKHMQNSFIAIDKKNDSVYLTNNKIHDSIWQYVYATQIQQNAKNINEDKEFDRIKMLFKYIIISLLIIILAFIIMAILIKKRFKSYSDRLNFYENMAKGIENEVDHLSVHTNSLLGLTNEMTQLINDLKNRFSELEKNQKAVMLYDAWIEEYLSKIDQVMKNNAGAEIVFYMGSPIDNYFSIKSKSFNYVPGQAVYKFVQREGLNNAEFEFLSDSETVKFVREDWMHIINPACKKLNQASKNTNSIITTQRGKAIYDNERWVIIDKATIKFE
jgi:uncharacterized protein YoxC